MAFYQINFDNRPSGGGGFLNQIGCLIFGVGFLVLSYFILKGLFTVLMWASPVLLIAALIIDWRVVAEAGKSYVRLLERNPLGGLLMGALIFFGFPFVALFLFLGALGSRKLGTMRREFEKRMSDEGIFQSEKTQTEGEYVDYEEIESKPKTQTPSKDVPVEPLELPEKERREPRKNPYDEMF